MEVAFPVQVAVGIVTGIQAHLTDHGKNNRRWSAGIRHERDVQYRCGIDDVVNCFNIISGGDNGQLMYNEGLLQPTLVFVSIHGV